MADRSPIQPQILDMQTPNANTQTQRVTFSPVLVRTSSEEYAKVIADILHDAVSTIKREYLRRDLEALFAANAVSDDNSFGCMDDSDLPAAATLSANPDFDAINVLSVPPVRKALFKIRTTVEILAGKSQYLQAGMVYFDIQKTLREESNAVQIGRVSSASASTSQTKEIRALKVDKFSGKLEDFAQWKRSVDLVFKQHGAERFLVSDLHCASNPSASFALVGTATIPPR